MNSPLYTHFRTFGWDNATMTCVCEIEVETRCELLQTERAEIDKYAGDKLCLNVNRPVITADEKRQTDKIYGQRRRAENKEEERLRVAEWRKNNPEKRAAQAKRSNEQQRQRRNLNTTF